MSDIEKKREEIVKLLLLQSENIKNTSINVISAADLELLFGLYDQVFFNSWFRDNFKGKIKFSLSRRMTKSAGLTLCPKNIDKIKPEELVIEIRIGVDFFFRYNRIGAGEAVCGIKTENSLQALILVFEHEICHVLEFLQYKKSSCKAQRFKTMAKGLFGHTESYHKLPTNRQIAVQKLGLHPGSVVSFAFEGEKLTGILHNINKRATVMVKDKHGAFADKQGNRYAKYYVPLSQLL